MIGVGEVNDGDFFRCQVFVEGINFLSPDINRCPTVIALVSSGGRDEECQARCRIDPTVGAAQDTIVSKIIWD